MIDPETRYSRLIKIAFGLYEADRFDDALSFLCRTTVTAEITTLCGLCHKELMNFSQAENAFKAALKIDPGETDAWWFLAMLCKDTFRPGEALDAFEHYLKLNPCDPVALFEYSVVLMDLNKWDIAYNALKLAHTIDPDDSYVTINLAVTIIHHKRRPMAALWLLQNAFRRKPMDVDIMYYYAKMAWDTGSELTCLSIREMLQLIDEEKCGELDEEIGRQRW